jgi:HAD superfamily hydrolase (TIGR01549 family)
MKYGIIFDCDGTLVNSLGQAMESFNYALDKIGYPARTAEEIKRHFGAGADRIFLALLGDKAASKHAFEHYLDHQSELAKTTRLHDGIRELLDALIEYQVPLGLVTGRHARDLDLVIKPHSLIEHFSAIVADSHLTRSKPAPDGILMAAAKMGLNPQNTLYVGDSVMDIQAAHAARAVPVAALWDTLAKREDMLKERPALMAETPRDVLVFFRRLEPFRP